VGETTVTQLLDRPLANGSTLYPRMRPVSPGVQAAEDFYLSGSGQPARQIAIQVTGSDGSLRRTWLASHMEEQVNALLRLRPGWDGRHALPLSDEAVGSAIGLLFAVASDLSLPPQLFPLPDGGLQMEWHAGQSVEVEIDAAGDAHVLVADETGAIVINEEVTPGDESQLSRTRQAIEQLSVRLTRAR
jgi:hypothetical protein